jgi:hypothetical protein
MLIEAAWSYRFPARRIRFIDGGYRIDRQSAFHLDAVPAQMRVRQSPRKRVDFNDPRCFGCRVRIVSLIVV